MAEPEYDALEQRLQAAGVDQGTDPVATWRQLRAAEGAAATIIDLYEIAARPRGLCAQDLPKDERHALARAVMPDIWPGFTTTDGSERPEDPIEIVDYDPSWPAKYREWEQALAAALGAAAVRIEHVGSTAVPGLPAKPTIDVQVSVRDLDDEDSYVAPIESLGLQLRSRDVYHRYFRPVATRPRDVHVHVCAAGSSWEADHLRFRDCLRPDADARDRYAAVKRAAAATWTDDRVAYTEAKSEVILDILERNARAC